MFPYRTGSVDFFVLMNSATRRLKAWGLGFRDSGCLGSRVFWV